MGDWRAYSESESNRAARNARGRWLWKRLLAGILYGGMAALLFGLGHLPATAAMAPLTQTLVVRALVLNGVAGVAFGYLYWRHGLEAAMVGHMSAHLSMQVPGVMLLRNML